jgi:hypothetical protein
MNINRLISITAGTCLALAGHLAVAAGPNYTYAEAGYTNVDGDHIEANGASVNISYGATDHIFVKLGYTRLVLDELTSGMTIASDGDADRFQIGLGGHFGITDNIDVLAAVSYVDIEFTGITPLSSFGDDGYLAEAGVRAMVTKKLELNATVSALHLGSDDDTGYGVGAVFNLKKRWSLAGSYRQFQDDDEGELFAGLRFRL